MKRLLASLLTAAVAIAVQPVTAEAVTRKGEPSWGRPQYAKQIDGVIVPLHWEEMWEIESINGVSPKPGNRQVRIGFQIWSTKTRGFNLRGTWGRIVQTDARVRVHTTNSNTPFDGDYDHRCNRTVPYEWNISNDLFLAHFCSIWIEAPKNIKGKDLRLTLKTNRGDRLQWRLPIFTKYEAVLVGAE